MRNIKRGKVLVVAATLLFFLGLIYAYSVLLAPLKQEFGWSISNMTLVFALSITSFTIGALFSGPLVRAGRGPVGLVIGGVLLALGFMGTALVPSGASFSTVCVSYGLMASAGIGLVYNIVIPTVSAWFPDKSGLSSGVCLMGFGLGGFALGPLMTLLYAVIPWRYVVASVGIALAALVVWSSRVIKAPQDGEASAFAQHAPAAGKKDVRPESKDATAAEMVSSKSFWLLYLFLFLLGSIGMGVTGIGRELPLSIGASEMAAVVTIGLVNVGSGLGRLASGSLLDRLGRARAMLGISCVAVIAPLLMMASVLAESLLVQAIACLLVGIGWGSAVVTMPYATRTIWGQENMAQNMAIVNTYSILASLLGSWGAGVLSNAVGSFMPALAIMTAMGAGSILVVRAMNGIARRPL